MKEKKRFETIRKGMGVIALAMTVFILFSGSGIPVVAASSSGDVGSWGRNNYGQLGDGTTTSRLTLVQVSGLVGVVEIANGDFHTIALKSDKTVSTWGINANGQLGDGTTTSRLTPVQVTSLTDVIKIAGGNAHTIALKSDGTVWAWGSNSYGQLGDGTTTSRLTPVKITGLIGVVEISCGYGHSIALKSDGTVWAWGSNSYGQLGDGTTTSRLTPVQVTGLTNVIKITGGAGITIALKSDGTVWSWGANTAGQLGDGTTTSRLTPVQVTSLTDVIKIAGGANHAMALKSDGTVWTWGHNTNGDIGDGTLSDRLSPVQVSGLINAIEIAAGSSHSIAIKSDGTVWTWGSNWYGQLGDGTTTHRWTPVQVPGLSNAIKISGGNVHTTAIASLLSAPPPPTSLIAVIMGPTNNFYSEESVSFKGIAEGGAPPYTYTWTSDIDGTLRTSSATESTTDEFSRTLSMGKHRLSLRIVDSTGFTSTFEEELNVVKQKIKILVVPVGHEGDVDSTDLDRINEMERKASEFYLKSSYGAIHLDFHNIEQPISLSSGTDLADANSVTKETLTQLSNGFPEYDTILIVDDYDGAGIEYQTYIPQFIKDLVKDTIVAIVPMRGQDQFGTWLHEIGHTLGYSVETSNPSKNPIIALWIKLNTPHCCDLYKFGNIDGWDVMAKGVYVYDSNKKDRHAQPTDLSALSKAELRWLTRGTPVTSAGEYSVVSTENLHYGDKILQFRPASSQNVIYDIEARELIQPSYYERHVNEFRSLNNGILIYKTEYMADGSGDKSSINIIRPTIGKILNPASPTFLASDGTSASGIDFSEFVEFKVTESNPSHPYNVKIKISACDICRNTKGAIMNTASSIFSGLGSIGSLLNPDINAISPDLDLHAYTPDGKHVGMNYSSGEYEMQIPGANASGDLIGGKEWIFVPSGTAVRYYVSSYDVQKFLEQNPDIESANATISYSTSFMEYGENPKEVQLSDGSWTITDRTVSLPKEREIAPGTIEEIQLYNFSGILQSVNQDGTSVFNLGRTIPVKFQLRNVTGDFVTTAIAKIYLAKISEDVSGTETEANSTSSATEGNLFRYDTTENQYIFNLATKTLTTGTWKIRIELDDGTSKYVNIGLK